MSSNATTTMSKVRMRSRRAIAWTVSAWLTCASGCGGVAPTSGTLSVFVEAEDTITNGIPAASGTGEGFADGWSLAYERFYVSVGAVQITATNEGSVTAPPIATGDRVFDLRATGPHEFFTVTDVAARRYDQVSYRSAPVSSATTFEDTIPAADRDAMQGSSTWITAVATRGSERIRIDWKFREGFEFHDCEGPPNRPGLGTVVASGGTSTLHLSIHGDHWYWQTLGVEGSPVRFDPIAHADSTAGPYRGNADGEVTLDELAAVLLADVPAEDGVFDPAGRPVSTIAGFMRETTGTNGHIDGDGVCASRSVPAP
jgi:hypothetical protein